MSVRRELGIPRLAVALLFLAHAACLHLGALASCRPAL